MNRLVSVMFRLNDGFDGRFQRNVFKRKVKPFFFFVILRLITDNKCHFTFQNPLFKTHYNVMYRCDSLFPVIFSKE